MNCFLKKLYSFGLFVYLGFEMQIGGIPHYSAVRAID